MSSPNSSYTTHNANPEELNLLQESVPITGTDKATGMPRFVAYGLTPTSDFKKRSKNYSRKENGVDIPFTRDEEVDEYSFSLQDAWFYVATSVGAKE